MTREEEIEQAAFNYINSDVVSAENMQLAFGDFINGAQWADKTMIDKALIIAFSVLAGRFENWTHIAIAFIVIYGLFDLYDFVKKKEDNQ